MTSWIEYIQTFNFPLLQMLMGLLIGAVIAIVISISMSLSIRKSQSSDLKFFRDRVKVGVRVFVPILTIFIALTYAADTLWTERMIKTFRILLILCSSMVLIQTVYALEDIFLERYDIHKEDNRKERKIITQLNFLRKVFIIGVVIITFAVILLSFDEGRKYGQTLLTSAGVASIIIGFAAQKTLSNFLAGIQIAFTQPIKIDDAVVVEDQWGWVEEINLTYVVVRIWDWRRLVLPITYFVEKPFQNWTRNKGEIIGSVILHLDYRTPISALRKKLNEILAEEPNWDGKVANLQVTDTKEHTIVVRALMSAKNSPLAWDLRCSVREQLIRFLKSKYPESLPLQRVSLNKD